MEPALQILYDAEIGREPCGDMAFTALAYRPSKISCLVPADRAIRKRLGDNTILSQLPR
jgi:hypothetical protein